MFFKFGKISASLCYFFLRWFPISVGIFFSFGKIPHFGWLINKYTFEMDTLNALSRTHTHYTYTHIYAYILCWGTTPTSGNVPRHWSERATRLVSLLQTSDEANSLSIFVILWTIWPTNCKTLESACSQNLIKIHQNAVARWKKSPEEVSSSSPEEMCTPGPDGFYEQLAFFRGYLCLLCRVFQGSILRFCPRLMLDGS